MPLSYVARTRMRQFAAWLGVSYLINRWAAQPDAAPKRVLVRRFQVVSAPGVYLAPFNPASLTVAMVALTMVGVIAARGGLPSASRCRRRPSGAERVEVSGAAALEPA